MYKSIFKYDQFDKSSKLTEQTVMIYMYID